MGCFVVLFALISPRLALVFVWLFSNVLDRAYDSFWVAAARLLPAAVDDARLRVHVGLRARGRGLRLVHRGLAFLIDLASYGSGRPEGARLIERRADVLIVGGGLGGVAAAIAAAGRGLDVVLSEPTDWIGGQLTSQAVPPDEHPWIETHGCTATYRALRDGIRAHYREHFPLTDAARAVAHLNPGACFVSRLGHEPRVALAVLEAMLPPASTCGSSMRRWRPRSRATAWRR